MHNPLSTNNLTSRKAAENDWDSILKLLDETKLTFCKPFTSIHFWRKTNFESIDKDDIKDIFAKKYINIVEKNFPDYFDRKATFYIEV